MVMLLVVYVVVMWMFFISVLKVYIIMVFDLAIV